MEKGPKRNKRGETFDGLPPLDFPLLTTNPRGLRPPDWMEPPGTGDEWTGDEGMAARVRAAPQDEGRGPLSVAATPRHLPP